MNGFLIVNQLLSEGSEDVSNKDVQGDPRLMVTKKKAVALRTKAELMRARNQILKAKLDFLLSLTQL